MNKKFFIVSLALVALLSGVVFMNDGLTKTKAYYSGDAIEYQGKLVIASANTGSLEIFKFVDGKLANVVKQPAPVDGQVRSSTYNDVLFNIEEDSLYVYATSGSTLYKYDFSNLANITLVNSSRDNTWDWLGHLDRINGRIVTSGSKAVKLWNTDLQVVDSFKLANQTNPYNVRVDADSHFIFNINGAKLQIFDRDYRSVTRELDLNVNVATGNKQLYSEDNMLYVIDDQALTKVSVTGDIYKTLKHDSQFGYDVVASRDGRSLYASNGATVLKINKNDFSSVAKFADSKLKVASSWAMGLKQVTTAKGEVLVVFNNSNILVLDNGLRPYAMVLATEEEGFTLPSESMFITASKNAGAPLSEVTVTGGGFGSNEDIKITFAETNYQTKADSQGRFSAVVVVPSGLKDQGRVDIKAAGVISGRHYSTAFTINYLQ
jgi:hypothetical protein